MKKIVLILDGMADRGQDILSGKTPLEYANTPNLDNLYKVAEAGCVQTIPDGEEAGSAVANLNLLGFTSAKVYKGRAVIEAAGAGIKIDEDNLYIRTNFISFKGESFDKSVIDSYGAHDIETCKSTKLAARLNDELFEDGYELINTGSFRNILVVKNKTDLYPHLRFMPPHDMLGQPIMDYLDGNSESNAFYSIIKKAYDILSKDNDTKANGIWFWGASIAPNLRSEKVVDKKIILSETILMRGIANLAGIDCVSVAEDDGFEVFLKDKLAASKKAIEGDYDFLYIHIQKPDDLSHELLPKEKAEALQMIDEVFVSKLIEVLDNIDEKYSLTVASDHYTFSDTGGHGREPAPFMLIKSDAREKINNENFSERNCVSKQNTITPKELLAKQ